MDSKLEVPPADWKYESDASAGSDVPPPVYRRNSESSTERSLYDDKDQAMWTSPHHQHQQPAAGSATSSPVREYGFYHPKMLTRGVVITDVAGSTGNGKKPLYYVEVSHYKLGKPDVILHAVPSTTPISEELEQAASTGETGPVLGVAHLPKLSRHYKVGLGDPATTQDLSWIEMRNPNIMYHGEYRMTLPTSTGARSYTWKRTHNAAAGVEGSGAMRYMTHNSFQLTDSATGEVIAVYLENKFKSWKKKGKLRIFRDLDATGAPDDQQLKMLVFLSISAILEKARRRANARNSSGGGGGGSGGS